MENMGKKKIIVRIYLICYKLNSKIFKFLTNLIYFIQSIFEGFWLGVLNNESINEITNYYYSHSKQYNSQEWNRKGFFKMEKFLIDRYFKKCKKILVISAGSGREVIQLIKLGYHVDAYECNKNLVKKGNILIKNAGYKQKILYLKEDKFPNVNTIYDGVVFGWGGYSHIRGEHNRVRLLKNIKNSMKKNAPILISFWTLYGESNKYNRFRKITTNIAKTFSILRKNNKTELGEQLTYLFGVYFSKSKIQDEIKNVGFNEIYYDNKEYGYIVGVNEI